MFPRFASYQRAAEVSCTIFVFRGAKFAPRSIHKERQSFFPSTVRSRSRNARVHNCSHPRGWHRPRSYRRWSRSFACAHTKGWPFSAEGRNLSVGLALLQETWRDDAEKWPRSPPAVQRYLFWRRGRSRCSRPHNTLGMRLAICQGFDQYVNLRPTRILQGLSSPLHDCKPGDLDWAIVRENTEGEYAGQGGRAHRGFPEEVATETSIFTRRGVTRIMRFAFKLAQARPRKLLTVVTKSNAQRHGMVLWDEIAAEVANEFPDVTWDKMLVDAMTTRMVAKPASLDTIVATNLHADILSDLAAALAGSLGIAPTANLDPERRFPSMFEPIHGAAFDITGKGIANPIGALWTAAMMLEHLGEKDAALQLMHAVERVTASGFHTPDLGGKATTREVTSAVCDAIHSSGI